MKESLRGRTRFQYRPGLERASDSDDKSERVAGGRWTVVVKRSLVGGHQLNGFDQFRKGLR